MNPVGSIPFHVAQAYGVRAGSTVQAPASSRRAPSVEPVQPQQSLRLYHPQGGSKANPQVARLVAGVVPGGVDFSASDPQGDPSSASRRALVMYHHPADRNAAATGVGVGRMLDTSA